MQYRLCIIILFLTFTISYSQNHFLEIVAKDLSEDATLMSSHNDELVLLIYEVQGTNKELTSPVFVNTFELDTLVRSKTFKELVLNNQTYVFFLIENDDNRPVQQIDPVIRVYWQNIISLFNDKKYVELNAYLGDNDLLGYFTFNNSNKESDMEIKGRQSLDTYHYLLKIK